MDLGEGTREQALDALLQRAVAGDATALADLLPACAHEVRRLMERRAGPEVRRYLSLSDLEQEVLARVPGLLDRLREGAGWEDLRALLAQHVRWVVGNTVRDRRHYAGESVAPADGGAPCAATPSVGEVTRGDERAWLLARLDGLDPELAQVVRLRLEDLTFEAVAQRLGISKTTARLRYLRAAQELRGVPPSPSRGTGTPRQA